MSVILFDEIIEMLNSAMFRMHIKAIMFQFLNAQSKAGALSVVRTVGSPKAFTNLFINI